MSRAGGQQPESILRAGIDHAAALAHVHAGLFDPAWDEGSFKRLLSHSGSAALLARAGRSGEVVGFVVGRVAADEMEILSLGVAEHRQRHGIGGRLLEALVREARQREVRRLYLEVAAGNSAARALYDRLGFQECGLRRGYYTRAGAPAEDAVSLSLTL